MLDAPHISASGVLLKRTTHGYTWSIAVVASTQLVDDLEEATETAVAIDNLLRTHFPTAIPARAAT